MSFIGGIFTASFYYPKYFSGIVIIVFLVISLIFISIFWESKPAKVAGFCLLFFAFGIWIFNQKAGKINNFKEEKTFSGEVKIVKEPEMKNWNQAVVVEAEDNFRILVFTDKYAEHQYGEKLKF